jgi:uncharacterized membrane-anchored protein
MRSVLPLAMLVLLAGCAGQGARFGASIDPSARELDAALAAAQRMKVSGPARVQLADRTVFLLPWNRSFIPPAEAERLLRALGDAPARTGLVKNSRLLGLVVHSDLAGTEYAALYARDRGAPPVVDVMGWRRAPELAGLGEY